MDTQEPSIFSEALLPTTKSSPQKAKDLVLGFLVGAVIAAAIIIFLHLTNDNIRTAEDINTKCKMPLLGMVPMQEKDKKKDKKSAKKDTNSSDSEIVKTVSPKIKKDPIHRRKQRSLRIHMPM